MRDGTAGAFSLPQAVWFDAAEKVPLVFSPSGLLCDAVMWD
jgi:hypothetical protein